MEGVRAQRAIAVGAGGRWLLAALVASVVMLVPAVAHAGLPYIDAHRGGTLATERGKQVPVRPEETFKTFRHAARAGYTLELDVKLTKDRVPVTIHDATLDRTTNCEGEVAGYTYEQLRSDCVVDTLGTDGNDKPMKANDPLRAPVPKLLRILRMAEGQGADVNLEIKNLPGDSDFDPTSAYAKRVIQTIKHSGFPPQSLIVQSFWAANLDVVKADPYFGDATTSFLSLDAVNQAGIGIAQSHGYDWVSPQWPVDAAYIERAHAAGLRVIPFTVDTEADLKSAASLGVDAVITNDPDLARQTANSVEPPAPKLGPPPTKSECKRILAPNQAPPAIALHPDPEGTGPRVFAMQYEQEVRSVTTYDSFRKKIECMIIKYVKPHMAKDRPNVVALNEDVGLMTLATGSRGKPARDIVNDPNTPSCEGQAVPCGVATVIAAIQDSYADQIDAYKTRFPGMALIAATFVGTTDTSARGWMTTFSLLAKRYGVYILGSNDQPPFRESVDPSEIAQFADPDVKSPKTAFVATSGKAYNEAFMWGPKDVTDEGPRPLRNVVTSNRKVPLTPIERTIQLTPGPSTGPDAVANLTPYRIPGTKAKMAFATSLPAFVYNGGAVTPFGEAPPRGVDPCSDTARYYMYCADQLGANMIMQDEANPGRWATQANETWQPLEWMSSTWRAVADPTVGFDYNVTPHMVGNLADLVFDGQTAITQRGLGAGAKKGAGCNYIGDSQRVPGEDQDQYEVYAGPKTEFLGLAPWVTPDAPRAALRATASELAPASTDPLADHYVETAVVADLTFPPDPTRDFCVGAK